MKLLAIDTGTTETGFCLTNMETYFPIHFGKVANADVLSLIESLDPATTCAALEGFACYGMPIGQSTIESITWNGRFIQALETKGIKWQYIYRKEVKMNICGTMKAKDANIRQALIDRFGQVGTKKAPGFFYGIKADVWSAFAIATTAIDKERTNEQINI